MRYSLHINNVCNLRCTYCYEDDKQQQGRKNFQISFEEIDERFQEFNERGDCNEVELLGGEVFLTFDKVQYIFDKYGAKYKFLITTNGTINSPEIKALMEKHQPFVGVSLDDPQTTERQRIGINFQDVLNNAKLWNKLTTVNIAAVINPLNMKRIKETFDFYLQEQDFNGMHFGVVEEWMNDYYWELYVREGFRLVDETPKEVLLSKHVSPWWEYFPTTKEIIYEDGIEKIEIFHEGVKEITPYTAAKHQIYQKYCNKIGKEIKEIKLIKEKNNG